MSPGFLGAAQSAVGVMFIFNITLAIVFFGQRVLCPPSMKILAQAVLIPASVFSSMVLLVVPVYSELTEGTEGAQKFLRASSSFF